MAVEAGKFLGDQLAKLPDDHPDRPFLAGLHAAVTAYVDRTDPSIGGEDLASDTLVQSTVDADAVLDAPVPAAELTDLDGANSAAEPGAATAQAEQQERERVHLRGRMGKRVRYSTTPRGVRRAEFNLAVAVDEDHADWHTVLAFRDRADKLEQANPKSGQYVEVIGYRHTEERKTRDGQPKTVERVIAAHIRLR